MTCLICIVDALLLLLTISTLKSQNPHVIKNGHKKNVRAFYANGNKVTTVDIISAKVAGRSSKCAACMYFINCFMSGRYSMSLKHACLYSMCVFPARCLSISLSLCAARCACACIYVYCLCQ